MRIVFKRKPKTPEEAIEMVKGNIVTEETPTESTPTEPTETPTEETTSTTETTSTESTPAEEEITIEELLKDVDLDELLSQETIAKKVQSIADQRVTQALNTARSKWEAEAAGTTNAEDAARQSLEEERAAFEAEKAAYLREARLAKASRLLVEAGLPDIANFVVGETDEETAGNILKIGEILNGWKGRQVVKNGSLEAPKDTTPQKALTLDEIRGMSESEINERWDEIQEVLKKA